MKLARDTLDHFVAETDRLGGPGAPACAAFWSGLEYRPATALDAELDPTGPRYMAQQMALYRELTGHDYHDARDEISNGVPVAALLNAPNAYDHGEPAQLAKHYVAMGHLVQQLELPRGARILELGSGWGFTQEFLAQCGYETVGLEMNPDFVSASNARLERLGFGRRVVQGTFDSYDVASLGAFDCVMAYEAFHHAVDPFAAVKKFAACLKPDGRFALAAEPFNSYYRTWGLRLDPYSIYSIRKFGWFESGWSAPYMADLFGRCGLEARFVERDWNELTRYLIGRRSNRRLPMQLGMWDPAIAAGWWVDPEFHCGRGRSRLLLTPPPGVTGFALQAVNFSTRPLDVALSAGLHEQRFAVPPGDAELALPIASRETFALDVSSDTYVPAELGINADTRALGLHVRSLTWR